jgi:hypothetical protein
MILSGIFDKDAPIWLVLRGETELITSAHFQNYIKPPNALELTMFTTALLYPLAY